MSARIVTDIVLIHNAARSCRVPSSSSRRDRPLWALVRDRFSVGSTSAKTLCRRFDYDPEEWIPVPITSEDEEG